jgi:hypothetical protein
MTTLSTLRFATNAAHFPESRESMPYPHHVVTIVTQPHERNSRPGADITRSHSHFTQHTDIVPVPDV